MADTVLRATPEMLDTYRQECKDSSLSLRKEIRRIRDLMDRLNRAIESPVMTVKSEKVSYGTQVCEVLANELEKLSRYAEEMNHLYSEAESSVIKAVSDLRVSALSDSSLL